VSHTLYNISVLILCRGVSPLTITINEKSINKQALWTEDRL